MVLLAVTVSACGGPDLGKQNFPRTTVTQTTAATGPVDDPEVALDAQRTVDPCAMLQGDTVTAVGTPVEDGLHSSGLDRCSIEVTDAGGKEARLSLTMGDSLFLSSVPQIGVVEGLPVVANSLDDPDTTENEGCVVSAITSSTPALGISVQVTYDGGDACGAGMTVIREVVAKMHAGPPRLSRAANSAVPLDPCTLAADAVVADVLGRGTAKRPGGLHECHWSGGNADGHLRISETVEPSDGDDGTRVDLGGGTTGYQEKRTTAGNSCAIAWTHLRTGDGEGEVVKFTYDNFHDDAAGDDSCGKARRIVDTILPKLPKS
ncbi:hypothetical protein GCM10017786_56630 [Amycolatopsis deserti]|uniref:DUF3558 domain-containing protein n=1 Tax=Amycolatopsis deserti TaxID=185696 RepID=A0ABQ3JBX1_9PSEU|nr:hypothetical protein GCM10017786_56630 [Amycolatopsis deserti]